MKKIILFNLLLSTFVYSQTNNTTEQTSSKIKVYSPSSSSTSSSYSDTYKWTVKTDLFSFVSGEFPIIGEYRFHKNISAEVSAGVTYGFYENFGLFDEEYDGEGSTFESKAAMGSSFRVGVKYYASSDYDAIEGWAFGIQFFTRTNNRDYTYNEYSDFDLSGEQDSRNKTGLALTISKQAFSDSNISLEWLLGIGFAKTKHDFYTENYNDEGSYLKTNTIEDTVPNIQLGLRLGFGN
jgi:hypothetical protein